MTSGLYHMCVARPASGLRAALRSGSRLALGAAVIMVVGSADVYSSEAADQLLQSSEVPSTKVAALEEKFGWVVMPIPIKNPTVGTGLAAVGMLTYSLDDDSPPSSTALFGGRTDNGSWLAGLKQSAFWSSDRLRFDLVAGRGEANLKYFGREGGIDLSGRPIDYTLHGWFLQPRFSVRATSRWFAGLQATMLSADVGLDLFGFIPALQRNTMLVGLGPLLTFDSRDNQFNPSRGAYSELRALRYDGRWGSDFDYDKFRFFYNYYFPLTPSMTLAMRVNSVVTDGDVPFFDQPSLSLRGFPAGRYQDEQMIATEAELRWCFSGRWTVVGMLGAGKVARDVDGFGDAQTVVSRGAGIRFLASKKDRINIGIDFARGPNDEAIYFRVGEAF